MAPTGGEEELPLKLKYGQGSISKRSRPLIKGTYTYYQGRVNLDGDTINVSARTQKECANKLKKALSNAKKGTPKPQSANNKLTFGEWIETWYRLYKTPNVKDASLRSIRNTLDIHIIPKIGDVQLNKITSNFLQEFMSTLPAINTRNKIYDVLRGSLRKATASHYFTTNPADGIEIKKVASEKRRAFTFAEQNMVLEKIDIPKYKALFLFLCCTGLRIGELLSLTQEDIDFENGYIKVDSSKDQCTKKEGTTKTGEIRYVPFISELFDKIKAITNTDKFIGTYTVDGCHCFFYKLFKRIGLKDVSTHSTRHTFASVCYFLRVPDKYTQKWLGHATLAMTVDTYTDILGKGISPVLEYLKALWAATEIK